MAINIPTDLLKEISGPSCISKSCPRLQAPGFKKHLSLRESGPSGSISGSATVLLGSSAQHREHALPTKQEVRS